MKTRFTWGMATILAAAITVAAQTPAVAPVAPEPPQAAPLAVKPAMPAPLAAKPKVAIPAPAPFAHPMPDSDFAFEPFAIPAIAPLASLDAMALAGLDRLDFDSEKLEAMAKRLADQSSDLSESITDKINAKIDIKLGDKISAKISKDITDFAVDQAEMAALAPLAKLAGQDPDPARAADMARRAQEMAERAQERAQEMAQRQAERGLTKGNEEALYRRGTSLLDAAEWDKAVQAFDAVIQKNGTRADGATYWKAWALYKEGQKDPSLTTLKSLETGFPKSRWLNDAKALEVEVKQSTGQAVSPGSVSDEDLKLLALQGLMHSDPDAALPVLDKLLKGSGSPKLKERALFVLSTQANGTKARELLAQMARGASNPDLQVKAITYLSRTGPDSRPILAEIYSSSDETVKRRILEGYRETGDKDHLLAVAKSDPSAELRQEAISYLASMNARDEIWQLYAAEVSADVKKQIISSLYSDGFSPKVAEIARTEKDPALRRSAIRTLSHFGRSNDLLAGLYDGEKDDQNKREIINGLHAKGDAKALVEIARKETNPELKREIVSRLATMKSKEATDYMVELLNK